MKLPKGRMYPGVLFLALFMVTAGAYAGGPLYVTGLTASQPGQPYRWILNPIPYRTDQGGLGNQTNLQADSLVSEAFRVWQDVGTADISFQNSGHLGMDVTASSILIFQNAFRNCADAGQPANAIIYDLNGSILTALGIDNNSVLGFAGPICTDDMAGAYKRGWAVLNGRFIDGQPNTPSHRTVTLDVFKATFVHEFGHLIGLDHSQINLNCLTAAPCSGEDMAGLPTMFPILIDASQAVLKTDDKAALSMLYPAPNFSSTTGRIQGRVLFSDGLTQAQGYNVIARQVGDPRRTAVSCVSGFLYTAGAGNTLVPDGNDNEVFYGSRDQALIGFYDIAGLPPGTYTIEVEGINNSADRPFTGSSGVGPLGTYLGFQYKLPGRCSPQYLNFPSSPGDDCSAKTFVTVGPGSVVSANTDIIFLGTPPRYDAWEDGP